MNSSRHSRQSFLGETSEATIKNTAVAVIGLCGGGSHVSQQLAHIGVGKLVLVDSDFAEDSNRNRMVGLTHAEAQAQARKVEVIAARVAAVSPETELLKHDGSWNRALGLLKKVDFIFGCVDTMSARDELERFARRHRIPYIDVGMDVHGEEGRYFISGQVITSLPSQPCMRCMGFVNDAKLAAENARYGAAGGRPQVVWPNGVLASTAVGVFMALLNPWNDMTPPPLYIEYDGNRCTTAPSPKLAHLAPGLCRHMEGTEGEGDIF
jgi:molybdopterin-synthase adenylyltransferase